MLFFNPSKGEEGLPTFAGVPVAKQNWCESQLLLPKKTPSKFIISKVYESFYSMSND